MQDRGMVAVALGLALGLGSAAAQDVEQLPGATHMVRVPEAAIDGLVRRNVDTVAFTVPGKAGGASADATAAAAQLLIHDFDFNGDPVRTDKLHLRQIAPGVVEITSVAWEVGYWRFSVRDAASYFGMGERFDALNHAHTVVKNLSVDNEGVKGTSSYKPIPFFMSTSGYGLWVDTTGEATFDLNATDKSEIVVDVASAKLRIVLFTGPEFPGILEKFTAQAGRAIVPPYWAFAPWKARDYHQNEAQVKEDVDKTRALGLPASVILIDSPWSTAYNDYKFNSKQFDDAPGMVKYIHDNAYKLVLWHTPWINSKSDPPKEVGFEGKIAPLADNYQFAADQNLFVKNANGSPYVGRWWKGEGSMIDFTYPKAKQWWQDQVRQAIAAGADGFKDDDGEGNFFGDVKFADGTDARVMRNRYSVLYNNAVEELIQKDLKGNGVLLSRSVTVGANGIGFLWGGDNEASFSPLNGLPTVVTAGLGAGLSGMPLWGADLGGYEGIADTPNARLLERWTEYAAFSPLMEVMSSKNIGPWDFDSNEPAGGHEALDIYRKYAVLHMSLFPYRYAAAQEAAKTGMPLMRALVLNYQDDVRARSAKDEYLFGPDFLVAPVIDEGTQRTVYLPAGDWVNYWNGTQVAGGKVVVADAPVDVIPVWVRAGAVVPKIPEDVMTLVPQKESGNTTVKSLDNRRVYEVIGAGEGNAKIADFEGRVVERSGRSLKISGNAARVIVRWRFGTATGVTVNGASVKVQGGTVGSSVEFDHANESTLEWRDELLTIPVVAAPSAAAPGVTPMVAPVIRTEVQSVAEADASSVHRSTHRPRRSRHSAKALRKKRKTGDTAKPAQ